METNQILTEINDLRNLIKTYNKLYYDDDNPAVSDAAYDSLMMRLKDLEATHPEYITPDSPTQYVGGKPSSSFANVHHIAPLQSLRDVFNQGSVEEWYEDIKKHAFNQWLGSLEKGQNENYSGMVSVETKVDGLSCAVTYKDGVFVSAATRGDGRVGEDVTENVRKITGIPMVLRDKPEGITIVRCEVYMPVDEFKRLNAELEASGKKLFKNPRNAAAGSLRTKDAAETARRGLHAVAFCVLFADDPNLNISQISNLNWLARQGFEVVEFQPAFDIEDINRAIENIDDHRDEYPYAIDGAVIKLDNIHAQQHIGGTDKYPHWAIAFKYPPERKQTVLKEIQLQTGRTGVITPVAVFDPVTLAGTTVTKATLHNQGFMDTVLGGIAAGDTIIVHKSGEIIPEVLYRDKSTRPAGTKDFEITHCPACGAHAVLGADDNGNGTQMYCSNPDCPATLEGRLTYWCSRHVMDIEGLGPKNITKLMSAGVQAIEDLYAISETELTDVFGSVLGPKILAAIRDSRYRNIDRLIAGLGIPGVGRHIGETLAREYPDIYAIAEAASARNLIHIDGIGEITEQDMCAWFSSDNNISFLKKLETLGVNIASQTFRPTGTSDAEGKPLSGLTFVITGTLEGMSRDEAGSFIENNGGKVTGSVSKKTNYLLAGANVGATKLNKATSLGVKIISLDELRQMIGE